VPRKWIQWIEAGYVAALPFLGAWSALELDSDYAQWIIFGGWLLATMNIYIYVPVILQGMGRNWVLLALPLARILVLAFKQSESDGSLWAFFLDEALIETGSLMIGFALYFLFGTGIAGTSAWSEFGLLGVLLFVLLFLGSVGGFVMACLEQQPEGRWDTVVYMGLALALSVWQKIGFITAIKNGEANPDAVFTENFMILALAPLAYILVLPALFALRTWIANEWF
tara:strand:- start:51155 stop:51832 length:678 start_codon:yes stop_codon:yes gene_type:complete